MSQISGIGNEVARLYLAGQQQAGNARQPTLAEAVQVARQDRLRFEGPQTLADLLEDARLRDEEAGLTDADLLPGFAPAVNEPATPTAAAPATPSSAPASPPTTGNSAAYANSPQLLTGEQLDRLV